MIAVLFSGGMDSWACLNWAIQKFGVENVQPIYYNFGQKCSAREQAAGIKLCKKLGLVFETIDIPETLLQEDTNTGHVPLRNLMFILLTATREDYDGIVFGMLKGESSEDKNPKFVKNVQKLLDSQFVSTAYRSESRRFQIYTPFAHMTKVETVAWIRKNVKGEGLFHTVACYSELGDCGHCASCIGRWVAFELNDLDLKYKVRHPFDTLKYFIKGEIDFPLKERKLPLSSIPTRMYRLWEVFRAANHYSKRTFECNLLHYIKIHKLRKPIMKRLYAQIGGK